MNGKYFGLCQLSGVYARIARVAYVEKVTKIQFSM